MKFSCSRRDLHESLQKVARVVSGRSVLPILSNVLQALRRASIVAREDGNRVVLRTDGEHLTVTARAGELGEAYERLEVVREGDDCEIALSFRYLLDTLTVIDSEGVYLETTAQPLVPTVIRPVEDGDCVTVIAPVRHA